MNYERLSTTEKYNLAMSNRYNLESSRDELEERYGPEIEDLFQDDEKFFSSGEGLSMQPLMDLASAIAWAYGTPKKAIITSSVIFFGGIKLGFITLPVVAFKVLGWTGAGMVAASVGYFTRDAAKKLGKESRKKRV